MKEKEKYLILLHARDFNSGRGMGYGEFFERRPKSMEDTSIHEMSEIFDKQLRLKEGLLKLGDRGRYLLTEKGERCLNKYLRKAGIIELFNLSKLVPEFGLNYRIKMIEGFIGSAIIMLVFGLIIQNKLQYFQMHPILALLVGLFGGIFLLFFFITGITIVSNFIMSLSKNIFKSSTNLLKKHPKIIFYLILGISLVFTIICISLLIKHLTGYELKTILINLTLTVIGGIILFIVEKVFNLRNKFEKYVINRVKYS